MCDVPSIAAFCRESIEYFPGTASKLLLLLLLLLLPLRGARGSAVG
jgi:hypothetical protein